MMAINLKEYKKLRIIRITKLLGNLIYFSNNSKKKLLFNLTVKCKHHLTFTIKVYFKLFFFYFFFSFRKF